MGKLESYISNRRRTKGLRHYRKFKKRCRLLQKHPDMVYLLVGSSTIASGIILTLTESSLLGFLMFILCMALGYLWSSGKIF